MAAMCRHMYVNVTCKKPDSAVLSQATQPAVSAAVLAAIGDANANNVACLCTLAATGLHL